MLDQKVNGPYFSNYYGKQTRLVRLVVDQVKERWELDKFCVEVTNDGVRMGWMCLKIAKQGVNDV